MLSFEIEGGHTLSGHINPQGAKNEALQVICAVLLTSEPVTISNIPQIRDVIALIDIISDLGVEVRKINESTYRFQAKEVDIAYLESDSYEQKAASLRGSIMILGPLLARFGYAKIPK